MARNNKPIVYDTTLLIKISKQLKGDVKKVLKSQNKTTSQFIREQLSKLVK